MQYTDVKKKVDGILKVRELFIPQNAFTQHRLKRKLEREIAEESSYEDEDEDEDNEEDSSISSSMDEKRAPKMIPKTNTPNTSNINAIPFRRRGVAFEKQQVYKIQYKGAIIPDGILQSRNYQDLQMDNFIQNMHHVIKRYYSDPKTFKE